MKIKTQTLKNVLNKSIKGASNNKMFPLTSLIAIEVKDNVLTMISSDGSNYLYVSSNVDSEDFYCVVNADLFNKLVSKTTSEFMELEIDNDKLTIIGNGKYSIELILNEYGDTLVYPDPKSKITDDPKLIATLSDEEIYTILRSNKSALATSLVEPCYTGYYIHNSILTSDGYKVCCNDFDLSSTPLLISNEIMSLLDGATYAKICKVDDTDILIVDADTFKIYGHQMDCIDKFKVKELNSLIKTRMLYSCEINKQELLDVLDRLVLFVGAYDKGVIKLNFFKSNLTITNANSSSEEIIQFNTETDNEPFECSINIELLKSQVIAQTGNTLTIDYGNDRCIRLVDGKTTQVIALMVD